MAKKEDLIAQVAKFAQVFSAEGFNLLAALSYRSEEFIGDLALVLDAASRGEKHVVLPEQPESFTSRKGTAIVVRIDPSGKIIEREYLPVFSGVVYKASGSPKGEKIILEKVEFAKPEREVVLFSDRDKSQQIQAAGLVGNVKTRARYQRQPDETYEFKEARMDFGRLSGSISHNPYDNDELIIHPEKPAQYRFNGEPKQPLEIPTDGSIAGEVKSFPFRHSISVLRMDVAQGFLVDVCQADEHEKELRKYDRDHHFKFAVHRLAALPIIPESGTVMIDRGDVQIAALDDIVVALFALVPREIPISQ